MATKSWKLTDTRAGVFVEQLKIGPEDVSGAKGFSLAKRTLRGGLSDGVDVIHVDNGTFSFDVLPTRGMGLWKAWLCELEIGWKSPVAGPVHPKLVPLTDPGGLGWLEGFDELLVRCGLESNGAPDFDKDGRLAYPLHGRIANKPAHLVYVSFDGDRREITIVGVVDETRFHFQKLRLTSTIKTTLGEPGLRIHDEVQNLSGLPAEMQMLYHTNFGQPLVDPGSKFVAPLKTVVPATSRAAEGIKTWDSYANEEAGYAEQVYFTELLADGDGRTQTLLKNAHGTRGVSMRFNIRGLPYFTLWKNTVAAADGYVTGLEPATNFPNARSYETEQGRVTRLPPGGKVAFDLQIEVHGNTAGVQKAEKAIASLQGGTEILIHNKPQPGWSPS